VALRAFLQKTIREGDLTIHLPGGRSLRVGDGSGPAIVARITSPIWAARILLNAGLAAGEAYMDGGLVLEQGGIEDFVDLIGRNSTYRPKAPRGLVSKWKRLVQEANARRQARANVAHHYDLGDDLYRRFLDEDMQYSCAYFARPDMSLDEAQLAKKRHIAAKLLLRPGQKVLDIGCGWGGMALTLAEEAGADVLGITLSTEQLARAQARAEARGLAGRARFSLTDYRDTKGPFDRIVSVGMFEHVGRPNYQAFFDKLAELLTDDGVALLHTIGRVKPGVTNSWVGKYIFPGGHAPSLSQIMPAIERAGLYVTDIEFLRMHYAMTLRAWRERFAAHRAEIAELYDERFCRMWEFYLGVSEMSFRHRGQMVFQLQLAKRSDAVPITRDYIGEAEREGARRRGQDELRPRLAAG
jgi:cyclopropane-fatty-acyl-phospholipid synthase